MGLFIKHCWNGAYSYFDTWRKMLAHAAGYPPLELMQGFYEGHWEVLDRCDQGTRFEPSTLSLRSRLPIKWDLFEHDVLSVLLYHSDCDGIIEHKHCAPLAQRIRELVDKMPTSMQEDTRIFADGLIALHEECADVEFH